MTKSRSKTTSTAQLPTERPAAVPEPAVMPSPAADLYDALRPQMGARDANLEELLTQHPDILDASDFSCDEEDLADLEEALGCELPDDLRELLMFSDGGMLRSPMKVVHLASVEQLVMWAEQGVVDKLGSVPFATDDTGALLVVDAVGDYGGETGAVYRLERRQRGARTAQVHSAIRLADSVGQFLEHLAAGRDAC